VPFEYYARLSRPQQAVYRRSDTVTRVRLPRPAELWPLVAALDAALASESRVRCQAATERLILGLTDALGVQSVRVRVLAARPHAGWGELHGLYEAPRGARPLITLWMRTAKQRRVVAFRTFLRTLLHEVGHHLDYTLLKLADSYHTEGFYKRESSLFHQLVPSKEDAMHTYAEVGAMPRDEQVDRMRRAPDDLAAAIRGQSEAVLTKRPDETNWAANEVLCHLRDVEELFQVRMQMMLATEALKLLPIEPDRWAEERQYLRNDAEHALRAFRRRREETLAFLAGLKPEDWRRTAVHPARGPMALADFVTLLSWHDENHLEQLKRAVDGRP
jgi:uncharacterized damage-inducible protein DinB